MERSKRLLSLFPMAEIDIICQSDNHKLMMSQKQLERIGIVGAGPAGLFLAALLTDKGFCVDVFEQAPSLRADGCGIMLLPNGLRAIKRGCPEVYQDFCERGAILEFFDYYDVGTGDTKTVSLADYVPKYGFPIIYIHRKHISDALLKFIPDERIHTDYGFSSKEEKDDKVTAYFKNGTSWSGDLLIGADGIFSKVRQYLVGEVNPQYLGTMTWRGVISNDGFCQSKHFILFKRFNGVYSNLSDLEGGLVHWGLFVDMSEGSNLGEAVSPDEVQQILALTERKLAPIFRRVLEATPSSEIIRRPLLDIPPLARLVSSNVAIIGDAAHAMSPTRGQGLSTGFEDGLVLAHFLATCSNKSEALARYQSERQPRVTYIQTTSRERSLHNSRERKDISKTPSDRGINLLTYDFQPASI